MGADDGIGNDPQRWDNPFAGLPMFAEMAKALSGQGPLNWDAARQFAALAAPPGPNVDPTLRLAFEALVVIAQMQVCDVTGFDGAFPAMSALTPNAWALRALDAYRPLFTELATSLGRRPGLAAESPGDDDPAEPMMAMLGQLGQMMAPSMLGMAVGGMIGRLAVRAFGQYDLPIPRDEAHLIVVPETIDRFAADWDLPVDEMRLWVLTQEMTGIVLFSAGSVGNDLAALVRQFAGAFQPDPSAVADKLASLTDGTDDDPMQAMQRAFSDPALMLGAIQSPLQAELAPRLDAAVAAVVGYVDYMVDSAAARMIGGDALRIAEAVRRRRIETSVDDVYIERLLGMRLDQAQVQRGKTFVGGAVDRVGEQRVTDLFAMANALPTPAEIDAPGLWIARLSL